VSEIKLAPDAESLQNFLEEVVKKFYDQFWRTSPLLLFFDNVSEKSFLVEMQLLFLAEEVRNFSYSLVYVLF
jgi:hypothetical protein